MAGVLRRAGTKVKTIVTNAANDYQTTFKEMWKGFVTSPEKSIFKLLAVGVVGYGMHECPQEQEYLAQLADYNNRLVLLPESVRSATATEYIQDIMAAKCQGRLSFYNFGLVSVATKSEEPADLRLFTKTTFNMGYFDSLLYFRDHICDIGFRGRWMRMDEAMVDYDINDDYH